MPGCFPLRFPNLLLLCALCLLLSFPWAYPSRAAAARTVSSQHLQHLGSEPRKWVPFHGALIRRYKIDKLAHGEDEAEERHPADNLLRRHKADMTESYILGGY